ncbi:MAG: hypothetical protein GF317_08770 [Candidatus Lokiarchaeota archaeon]|nr:hypothetical protein [Candidatus Lokiarchaeota archaeon]
MKDNYYVYTNIPFNKKEEVTDKRTAKNRETVTYLLAGGLGDSPEKKGFSKEYYLLELPIKSQMFRATPSSWWLIF